MGGCHKYLFKRHQVLGVSICNGFLELSLIPNKTDWWKDIESYLVTAIQERGGLGGEEELKEKVVVVGDIDWKLSDASLLKLGDFEISIFGNWSSG